MLGLQKKVAKPKAKFKVFKEVEHPTAVLKMPYAPKKNASFEKTMQAKSNWNVPGMLDTPSQRFTERRGNRRYLTRKFKMRDLTSEA